MPGGSGTSTTEEKSHQVIVSGLRWAGGDVVKTLCFGCGKNDLGAYIEVGWMKPGNRVVMARRYLKDGDDKASWTVKMVKEAVLKKIYDEEEDTVVMPPWHCDVFNA